MASRDGAVPGFGFSTSSRTRTLPCASRSPATMPYMCSRPGAAAQHRVAQAQRLLLAHRDDAGQPGDLRHRVGLARLAALAQGVLELVGVVEVVLDGVLAAAVDDHDLPDPCGDRLLDDELD